MKYLIQRDNPDDCNKPILDTLENIIYVELLYGSELRFYHADGAITSYGSQWVWSFKVIN